MADLTGSKIQIMNGAGTNLFPRNRTVDIVDKAGNAVFDATTQQVKAAYLPSYVDDVIELQYLGSGTLPTFASASHANKWMFSTSNNKMYSGTTTAWVQTDWETGKIYVDVNGDAVEGTYRWTGTKPVKITEAPIATTDNVRPWTATGTAVSTLVPTELAVANAINSGVTSAITKTKSDIGKVVNTIKGTNPIGPTTAASGNVTISLNYGTTASNGVALKLDNTTSLIAYANLADGTSTGKGTVATVSKLEAYGAGATAAAVVFSLSALVSGTNTSAMTSTYLVPSIKLFHDVMSTAVGEYKSAVKSLTQAGSTITFTRLDGTTFTHTVTSAQYAASAGNGGVKSLTSKTDGLALNATTGDVQISGVAMTAATANAAGKLGMVQAPAGANTKYLRGDYTWQTISIPGVPISGVVGITPVSTVTNNKITSVHLHYGTGANNGVALKLANTTSIIASAALTDGTSTGKGTVATLGKLDAYGGGAAAGAVVFSLSAFVSGTNTSAMTSTYLVPSIKLFHDVMSNAIGEYKNAVSKITQAGSTVTYTKLDGTTGTYTCTSAQYAATAGNGGVKSVTSATAGLAINPTTGDVVISGVAFGAANANAAGSLGMVPAPAKGDQAKFLRADATWQTISIPGVPISGVVGITPVSTVTNNKVTSVHLHYGTGSTYGVYLELANTTSLVAKGKLTTGTSTGYGTVATLGKLDAYGNGSQAVFSLSAWVSGTNTSAMTSTYLVPSVKLLHDVASAAATEYKTAVSTITGDTNGNRTITYTRMDGTTGTFKYTDTNSTYTAVTGANIVANTNTNGLLNPANFNSKIVQSMGATGTTDMWASNQATATSLYIPSQRAILNNCLFYSTIA